MITHRSNVYAGASRVTHNDAVLDGRPIPIPCLPLFRTLWRRRGQWLSLHRLECLFQTCEETQYELARLDAFLLRFPGFVIETHTEKDEQEVEFTYHRLVTGETLPAQTRTGEAALAETRKVPLVVSLEEIGV